MELNSLRDIDHDARRALSQAMDWVIPRDTSLGAGAEPTLKALCDLVDSLGQECIREYETNLPSLTEARLMDPTDSFALQFIEHVRDVYYSTADSGAWADIRFEVTA